MGIDELRELIFPNGENAALEMLRRIFVPSLFLIFDRVMPGEIGRGIFQLSGQTIYKIGRDGDVFIDLGEILGLVFFDQFAIVRRRFMRMTSVMPTRRKMARDKKGKGSSHLAMRESSHKIIGRMTLRSLSKSTAESRKQSNSMPLTRRMSSGFFEARAFVHLQRQE